MQFVFIPNFCLKHKVYAADSMFSSKKHHQYMAYVFLLCISFERQHCFS